MSSDNMGTLPTSVGVVVIGRNEGVRLERCLRSVIGYAKQVVYVDSGSTDSSVSVAQGLGAEVVNLDLAIPFTAARARNEGFRHLRKLDHGLDYVQFVDGDCEIVSGWLDKARQFLDGHAEVVVVCGRRRERYPEKSIYNLLCDMEWDTPVGEARACGGDAMMRVEALEAVNGFRIELIAGEEPELCIRLRAAGGRVWRLAEEMTLHDAAMTRFGQWWKRSKRAGYAYAEGAALHGAPPDRHWVRESRSAWLWGLAIPSVTLIACLWGRAFVLALLLVYPFQVLRLFFRGDRSPQDNFLRAVFLVLGKFPEMLGQSSFIANRVFGNRSQLIEYK